MQKLRYLMLLTLAVLVFSSLIGCGTNQSAQTVEDQAESQPGEKSAEGNQVDGGQEAAEGLKEPDLLEEAKKEGKVIWFTAMPSPDAQAIADGFTKKYGIEVSIWRAQWDALLQKVIAGYRAGVYEVDVIEGPEIMTEGMNREGILQAYTPPSSSAYPEQLKTPEYNSYRMQYFTMGFNTDKRKSEDAPKTYEDLLKPQYKGKITLEDKTIELIAGMYQHLGEEKANEFFAKLKQQEPTGRHGQSNTVEMVAAGEVELFIGAYNYLIEQKKNDGAPVEWLSLEPVMAKSNAVAVAAKAPNPNAAKLFADFMLSVDGQKILSERNMIPAHPEVEANPPALGKGFEFLKVDSVSVLDDFDKWQSMLDELIKQ